MSLAVFGSSRRENVARHGKPLEALSRYVLRSAPFSGSEDARRLARRKRRETSRRAHAVGAGARSRSALESRSAFAGALWPDCWLGRLEERRRRSMKPHRVKPICTRDSAPQMQKSESRVQRMHANRLNEMRFPAFREEKGNAKRWPSPWRSSQRSGVNERGSECRSARAWSAVFPAS